MLNEEAQKGIQLKDRTDSVEAFRELRCLIGFIDSELKPVVEDFKAQRRKKVFFSDLWYLFRPGDLLYTPLDNKAEAGVARSLGKTQAFARKIGARFQEVWRIDATTNGRPNLRPWTAREEDQLVGQLVNPFELYAYYVDLDNVNSYEAVSCAFRIDAFPGQRDIRSLPFFPLKYLPDANYLCSKWSARGQAFREFCPFRHKHYLGRSLTSHPNGDSPMDDYLPKYAEHIDSEVVVDFSAALATNPGWQCRFDGDGLIGYASSEFEEHYPTTYWTYLWHGEISHMLNDYILPDWHLDTMLSMDQRRHDILMDGRDIRKSKVKHGDLTEDHLILFPNRVFAFVLRNRKFGRTLCLDLRRLLIANSNSYY